MNIHILPGDSLVEAFEKAGISGETIVFREALITGDVNAESLPEFWEQRAKYIAGTYGEDEIEYHEKVAEPIAGLADVNADNCINLWFEYELFCQVNMWFCLHLLRETKADLHRVSPVNCPADDVWSGFAHHGPEDLTHCFQKRKRFSDEDVEMGSRLWNAFRKRDYDALRELGQYKSVNFPFLEEVCEAAAEIDSRPYEIMDDIRESGVQTFSEAFEKFQERAGVYGFGDTQAEMIWEQTAD